MSVFWARNGELTTVSRRLHYSSSLRELRSAIRITEGIKETPRE